MAYEFTKLSDVEIAESPSEAANILIEDNGIIKKTSLSSVGGNGASTTPSGPAGIETINFTLGYYGNVEELDLFKQALTKNMNIHLLLKSNFHEEDYLCRMDVDFPRSGDHGVMHTDDNGKYHYMLGKVVPIWAPGYNNTYNQYVPTYVGFDVIISDINTMEIENVWALRDWDYTAYDNIPVPCWLEAAYATSI